MWKFDKWAIFCLGSQKIKLQKIPHIHFLILFVVIQYATAEALIADLELMFNNARHYNEEGSMVYEDANFLERMMRDKCRELRLGVAGK